MKEKHRCPFLKDCRYSQSAEHRSWSHSMRAGECLTKLMHMFEEGREDWGTLLLAEELFPVLSLIPANFMTLD